MVLTGLDLAFFAADHYDLSAAEFGHSGCCKARDDDPNKTCGKSCSPSR
jgi:hypothetical protein